MKKYVKPELFFEQFVLSQHIADCKLEYNGSSGLQSAENCIAFTDSDYFGSSYPVFIEGNTKCVDPFEEYCYADSVGGANTFTS